MKLSQLNFLYLICISLLCACADEKPYNPEMSAAFNESSFDIKFHSNGTMIKSKADLDALKASGQTSLNEDLSIVSKDIEQMYAQLDCLLMLVRCM